MQNTIVSGTVTQTIQEHEQQQPISPPVKIKLRKPRCRKQVNWDSKTVDNENMGKKKSKCCCIYVKPEDPNASSESSSENDDDNECKKCHGMNDINSNVNAYEYQTESDRKNLASHGGIDSGPTAITHTRIRVAKKGEIIPANHKNRNVTPNQPPKTDLHHHSHHEKMTNNDKNKNATHHNSPSTNNTSNRHQTPAPSAEIMGENSR